MIPFIGRFYVVEGYIRNTSTLHPTTSEVWLGREIVALTWASHS